MKGIFGSLSALLALLLCCSNPVLGQAPPQGISYQAVARNDDGSALVNADLGVRLSILEGSNSGDLVWEEEHDVSTDNYGLFSLVIGEGTPTGGSADSFATINWGGNSHFLQVELDPGDGIYELMGVTQMLSVPYALYAESSGGDDDADPANELIELVGMVGDSLLITEAGVEHFVDIGGALETATDECISLIQLSENNLNIVECGEAYVIDLTPLIDDGDWVHEGDVVYNDTDFIGVGTASPTSHLDLAGSVSFEITQVSGPATILLDENNHVVVANVTNDDVSLVLPSATTCTGRVYIFKLISTGLPNNLILLTAGTETVDLVDDVVVAGQTNTSFSIISDGENWWVINGSIVP